jgi:hypothetical protein
MATVWSRYDGNWHNPATWDTDCWTIGYPASGAHLELGTGSGDFNPSGSFSVFVNFKMVTRKAGFSGQEYRNPLIRKGDPDTNDLSWQISSFVRQLGVSPKIYDNNLLFEVSKTGAINESNAYVKTNEVQWSPYTSGVDPMWNVSTPNTPLYVYENDTTDSHKNMAALTYQYIGDGTSVLKCYLFTEANDGSGASYPNPWVYTISNAPGPINASSDYLYIGQKTARYYKVGYFDNVVLSQTQLEAMWEARQNRATFLSLMSSYNAQLYIDFSKDEDTTYTPEIGTYTLNVSGATNITSHNDLPNSTDAVVNKKQVTITTDLDVALVATTGEPSTNWSYENNGSPYSQASLESTSDKVVYYENLPGFPGQYEYQRFVVSDAKLRNYSTLTFAPTGSNTLQIGGSIYNEGTFQVGTATTPVNSDRIATIICKDDFWVKNLGTIASYGAPSYHMGDTTAQRTTLKYAVTLGAAKQIEFNDAVDYQTGDVIWLGKGADKTLEFWDDAGLDNGIGHGCEQVTLLSKISSSVYTANLSYNHSINDFVVHGTRNIIWKTETDAGYFAFRTQRFGTRDSLPSSRISYITVGDQPDTVFDTEVGSWEIAAYDFNWTRFEKLGAQVTGGEDWYGVIHYQGTGQFAQNNDLIVKNCLFDGSYRSDGVGVIGCESDGNFDVTQADMDEVHCWQLRSFFESDPGDIGGNLTVGHISLLDIIGSLKNYAISHPPAMRISSMWAVCQDVISSSILHGAVFTIGCLKAYHCGQLLDAATDTPYALEQESVIESGEVYHVRYTAITRSSSSRSKLRVQDVEFYDIYEWAFEASGWDENSDARAEFLGCVFDHCGRDDMHGAMYFNATAGASFDVILKDCLFGDESQNYRYNINFDDDFMQAAIGRFRIEDCEFTEPTGSVPTPTIWTDTLAWVFYNSNTASDRYLINSDRTIEIVRPVVYDSGDNDVWEIDYPDVTHFAIVGGGHEVRNLPEDDQRDGTYSMLLYYYSTDADHPGSRVVPIDIPVISGTVVQVELYVRKNMTMKTNRRPALHLRGPGINARVEMSDVIDTWEKVTVSGTATATGMAKFWVTGGTNLKDPTGPYTTGLSIGTVEVAFDGLTITTA